MKDAHTTRRPSALPQLRQTRTDDTVHHLDLEPLEADDDHAETHDRVSDIEVLAQATFIALSHGERVLYHALAPLLDANAGVEKRLAAGGRLLVVLDLPSTWREAVEGSLEAWIARVRVRFPAVPSTLLSRRPETSVDAGGPTVFSIRHAFRDVASMHVFLLRNERTLVSPPIRAALDADINVRIPFACFAEALVGVFPDAGALVEPAGFDAGRIDPGAFSSACNRSSSAVEVMSIVEAMSVEAGGARSERVSSRLPTDKKSVQPAIAPTFPTSPRLEDLHGYGAAEAWGHALCDDLAAYRAGDLAWSDVDTGCLLAGPPGTGKTLYASALAASAGLPFFATSFAHWQGNRGGHLGDVVRAMREWFQAASEAAPSILFIDEIDSIPARGSSREFDDYWRPIVNAMLELLDGTARREGLVVLAACNDAGRIDPAIVRSGRLDRRFEIGLPGEDDLVRIFGHHLPELEPSIVGSVATVLAGSASGADVARISREARRLARRQKRGILAGDLLAIAMPTDTRPEADRRLVAVHEAGHAVVAIALGHMPHSMSIVSAGSAHGGVHFGSREPVGRTGEFEAEVLISLAGRAAEEVILGEVSGGAVGDLQYSSAMVSRMIGKLGLGGRLLHSEQVDGHQVEARLQSLYARALRLVTEHRQQIEALAGIVGDVRVMSRRSLEEFARDHGLGGAR